MPYKYRINPDQCWDAFCEKPAEAEKDGGPRYCLEHYNDRYLSPPVEEKPATLKVVAPRDAGFTRGVLDTLPKGTVIELKATGTRAIILTQQVGDPDHIRMVCLTSFGIRLAESGLDYTYRILKNPTLTWEES
jgi:hypothetical protein